MKRLAHFIRVLAWNLAYKSSAPFPALQGCSQIARRRWAEEERREAVAEAVKRYLLLE